VGIDNGNIFLFHFKKMIKYNRANVCILFVEQCRSFGTRISAIMDIYLEILSPSPPTDSNRSKNLAKRIARQILKKFSCVSSRFL
jgi:hypothetical protein